MQSPIYFFVYSSLRQGFGNSAYNYITQFFSFESAAKVKGILSDLETEVVGTPTKDDFFIKGELYKLNDEKDFSWAFGQLDDYEGVNADPGEQPLYRRELTAAYKDNGEIVDAWIYWYNENVTGKPVIASGDVFEYLEQKKLKKI